MINDLFTVFALKFWNRLKVGEPRMYSERNYPAFTFKFTLDYSNRFNYQNGSCHTSKNYNRRIYTAFKSTAFRDAYPRPSSTIVCKQSTSVARQSECTYKSLLLHLLCYKNFLVNTVELLVDTNRSKQCFRLNASMFQAKRKIPPMLCLPCTFGSLESCDLRHPL